MGTSRRPGILDSGSAAPGVSASRHAHVLGGPNKATPPLRAARVSFVRLWAGYPSSHPYVDPTTGDDPPGFDNQCAIKLSVSLNAAGVDLSSFKGATVRVRGARLAIRAKELSAWLRMQRIDGMLGAVDITGENWQDKIKGRRGIVSFANYWTRPGETVPTGDHIDLWKEDTLTSSGWEGAVASFLRF